MEYKLEDWQLTYLREKGIIINSIADDIEKKVTKLTNSLKSNRNFILLVVKSLQVSGRVLEGVVFKWFLDTGLGFIVESSVTSKVFDEDYMEKLRNIPLLIVRHDPLVSVSDYKDPIIENLLLYRFYNKKPTVIERQSYDLILKKMPFLNKYKQLGFIFADSEQNNQTKIFLLKRKS